MRNKGIGLDRATAIRNRYVNESVTTARLARLEGLSYNTVYFIIRNWTYKDNTYGDLYSKHERNRR